MCTIRYLPVLKLLSAVLILSFLVQSVPAESVYSLVNSGNQFNGQRDYQDALLAFENALKIESGNIFALTGKSIALSGLGRYDEARVAAETALTIDPNFEYAWNSKGYALQGLNRYQDALDAFNKALAINPNNPYSWSGKSSILNQMGRPEEALSAAEKALAIDSSKSDIWNSKGYALERLTRYQDSLDAFNRAIAIDQDNPYSWSGKSNILNQMGRPEEALSAAEKALAIDSSKADIWNSKGYALLSLNRNQDALDTFNKALSIDAGNYYSLNGKREAENKVGKTVPAAVPGASPVTDTTSAATPSVTSVPGIPDKQDRMLPVIIITTVVCIGAAASAGIFLKKRSIKGSFRAGTTGEKDSFMEIKGEKEAIKPAFTAVTTTIHHDVFISYSHEDKPIADAICATLESHRIRCWIAPRDVLPGENFPVAIIQAIEVSRIMVLIFSSHSNNSGHVIRELTKAVSKGVIIIPFRIEDVPPSQAMEYLIGVPHWLDALTPPLEQHVARLAQTVMLLLEKSR